jgi:hypothetical protein
MIDDVMDQQFEMMIEMLLTSVLYYGDVEMSYKIISFSNKT